MNIQIRPEIEKQRDILDRRALAQALNEAVAEARDPHAGTPAVAAILHDATVLPPDPSTLSATTTLPPQGIDLRGHMANIELELIRAALAQCNGVVAHAAPLLGLRRTTLVEKLRKYGIERDSAELASEF